MLTGLIGIAICGLWLADLQQVTKIILDSPEVQFITALLFVTSALGLAYGIRAQPAGVRIASLLILVIGLATLVEYLTGVDLGIDHKFPSDGPTELTPFPGRMAISTTVTFIFAGMGILLTSSSLRAPWIPALASILGMTVVALGLAALLGYAFDLSAAYEWAGISSMALITGFMFAALGLAIVLSSIFASQASWHQLPWLSISVGIGLVALTGLSWSALRIRIPQAEAGLPEIVLALGISVSMLIAGMLAQLQHMKSQALQLIRRSAEIEDLYDNAPCGYHSLDRDGRIVSMNQTELNWLGYTRAEVLGGMHITSILTSPSLNLFVKSFPEFKRAGKVSDLELELSRKDGTTINVLVNAIAILDERGEYQSSRSSVIDVTERKLASDKLRQLAQVIEHTDDAVISKNLSSEILTWNAGAERMFGYSAAEVVGKPITIIFPDNMKHEEEFLLSRLRNGEHINQYDTKRITKSRLTLNVSVTLSPIYGDQGKVVAISKIIRDITSRIERETLLRNSEERFRTILENAPIGMAIVLLDGRFEQVNQELCEIVGYSKDELQGLTFQQITFPGDLDSDLESMNRLLEGSTSSYSMEKRYVRKGGGQIWVQLTGSLVRSAAGLPEYFIAQVQDISSKKHQQEYLKSLTQRLSLAVKAGHIGVWEWELDSGKLTWDEQMYAIYGIPEQSPVVYANWRDAVLPEDRAQAEGVLANSVRNKKTSVNQFRIMHPILGLRHIEAAEEVVLDADKKVFSVVGVNQDVTERKHLEDSLRLREAEVTQLSLIDPLTGLANRRKLDDHLRREVSRVERSGGRLAVIFADLDHFKGINDRFGHEVGDSVLKSFSRLINSQIRPADLAARFGGEEFVILLPDASAKDAVALAERIRSALERTTMAPLTVKVTASFGVSELRKGQSIAELLRSADKDLYVAKASGRNQTVCSNHNPA